MVASVIVEVAVILRVYSARESGDMYLLIYRSMPLTATKVVHYFQQM